MECQGCGFNTKKIKCEYCGNLQTDLKNVIASGLYSTNEIRVMLDLPIIIFNNPMV